MSVELHLGDCLDVLRTLPDASVDALVTDPPAGIAFMGQQWDTDKGGRSAWIAWLAAVMVECRRVIRPGGYSLTWALPRTSHWTATALEDAGWVIQDVITHHFGSGFPKHKNALKPASEHWILAYKPGKRSLNIDECRIAGSSTVRRNRAEMGYHGGNLAAEYVTGSTEGRWPANVILDEDAAADLDRQSGVRAGGAYPARRNVSHFGKGSGTTAPARINLAPGGASHFFYVAKASRSERGIANTHPTVKTLALMRYLCRLITPPGGVVLDPFMGSGSTGVSALTEGFRFLGIEREPEYLAMAEQRIAAVRPTLFCREEVTA
jgi:site-specific DNA-methyltransferase (adenine-specific)